MEVREYILKYVDPQVTIQPESKKDMKELMGWSEEEFLEHVFVKLKSPQKGCKDCMVLHSPENCPERSQTTGQGGKGK